MIYTTAVTFKAFATERRAARLSDDELGDSTNEAVLESVNSEVVAEIHGYLRGVVPSLPLQAPLDPLITLTTNEMMLARLYQRRNPSEFMAQNAYYEMYQNALKRLMRIQRGEIQIQIDGTDAALGTSNSSYVATETPSRFGIGFMD